MTRCYYDYVYCYYLHWNSNEKMGVYFRDSVINKIFNTQVLITFIGKVLPFAYSVNVVNIEAAVADNEIVANLERCC